MTLSRALTVGELEIVERIAKQLPMVKPWMKHISSEAVIQSIMTGEVSAAVLAEKYLFIFDVNTAWLTFEPILTELSLVVMYPDAPATFADAILGIEQLARERGAVGISVGTSIAANDEALAKLYESQGFTRIAIDLFKEIT